MAETKGKFDFKAILIALLLLQFACGTINNLFQPDSTSPENNDPTLTKEEPSPEPDTPTPIEEILPTQTPEPTPPHQPDQRWRGNQVGSCSTSRIS